MLNHTATQLLADFVSGAILGASISTVFFPMNVVKNHMQSKVGVAYENPFRVFSEVWLEREKSIRGLYLGVRKHMFALFLLVIFLAFVLVNTSFKVHLNFTRSLLAWGIINTVYELLRRTFKPLEDGDR
ncbi:hypothetical protein Y032_0102g3495 [Ancylostoma ceylanicum]|uniref:Uncharacterized protein n=1 Tax=Ancylostoma ceylanicum TaxID=53326 RepID=A0A016THQ3_9BILA|nr:hypothetical protein Y032_0102g3495 [Ancylostoma ceylanicum]